MKILLFIFSVLLITATAYPSDHIDGPVTKNHDVADISDLYVFKSPEDSRNVVFVVNTYPMVGKNGHFSEKVAYEFIVRRALLENQFVSTMSLDSISILCSIDEKNGHQFNINCSRNDSPIVNATYGDVFEDVNTGVKFYSDMVSDPFFLDKKWVDSLVQEGKLVTPKGENLMDKLNVLTLMLELPVSMLFEGHNDPNLVMAVTVRSIATQQNNEQLDWVGRPEITNFSMWPLGEDEELRDMFNLETPYDLSLTNKEIYKKRISDKILNHYDPADGQTNWSLEEALQMSEMFVNDFLLYAPNQACTGNDFLGIEEWMFFMRSDFNCGGRRLSDDIVDNVLSLYVTRDPDALDDDVTGPYKELPNTFPYSSEPSLERAAQFKAWLARKFK